MKLRTITAATTAVAALTLVLSGCAGGASGEVAGGTIEVQTGLASTDPNLKVLQDLSTSCTPKGMKLNLVPSTDTYEADMKARLASNDIPDVFSTHGWSLLRYSDFLEPLDEQPWAKNFNPALRAAMANVDGQFFALPINTDVAGIVYSKTALQAVGIDVSTLTTWDAFTAALKKLQDAGKTPIASSGKDSWMSGNIADLMASGAFTEADLKKFTDGTFVKPGYSTMLDEIGGWAKNGYINPDFTSATVDDIARGLADGSTGFVFVQNYIVNNALTLNPKAELGYFPIPSFVGKPYLVGGEGTAYGVSKTSKHKAMALEYLDCLAKPANLGAFATALGGIPGLTDATSDLGPLQDSYDAWVKDNAYPLQPYFDRVYLPNGSWDTMVTTTSAVITKQSDPAAATDQLAKQFDALFKKS